MGIFIIYKASKVQSAFYLDETNFTKKQLLLILEDLQLEYTPYYIHYYHSLSAIRHDYSDRPKLLAQLTKKIRERLEEKVKEVHV